MQETHLSYAPEIMALRPAAERRMAARVKPAAERALRQGHPWLFAESITQLGHAGNAGDLAVVFDRKGRFLAIGLYDPHSPIRVRVLAAGQPTPIDRAWFARQVEQAAARRDELLRSETNGYRVIHGENDGLPGLVVDRYADTLVMKLYTAAWTAHLRDVVDPLLERFAPRRVLLRLSRAVSRDAASDLQGLYDGQLLWGSALDEELTFQENGLRFAVDPIHGQKTGFFLDQRENRARVEQLADGAHVLNVFAYTGGFSLYAARGGARRVTSLDMSEPALEMARQNFALNQHVPAVAAAEHCVLVGDAFPELARLADAGRRFSLVVIDPPAFAKRQSEVDAALAAYAKLTQLGLRVLQSGGTIVLASCSSRVDSRAFRANARDAAQRAGRPLNIFEQTGHPVDHPIGFPEGSYLKCLFATT
jgi:23S rRNA (cytosine1962-C5)-methyltransferase